VDFESARIYKSRYGVRFLIQRDKDRNKLNQLFMTKLPTHDSIKAELRNLVKLERIYALMSLGHGIYTPGLFDRNLGFGKFHYSIKSLVKQISNGRILSLGSNNSALELMISVKFGSSVTCLELDKGNIGQAIFFHKALEWSTNREIDVNFVNSPMEEFNLAEKNYDLVISLCSIYYLEEPLIEDILSKVSFVTDEVLLQFNISPDIGRTRARDYELASPVHYLELLPRLSYVNLKLHQWKSYSRPIISASTLRKQLSTNHLPPK
jgi:hypothetical protein